MSALLSLLLFGSYAADSTLVKTGKGIDGEYKCGMETLFFNSKNGSFFLKRSLPKAEDVAIPICYDTIAKGGFKFLAGNTVLLSNDKNFSNVGFDLKQEKGLSDDTVYIKVVLPQDDAFFPGRFRFLFNFECAVRQMKSDTSLIKIPRTTLNICRSYVLSFTIQDLTPQWTIEEEKTYQRFFFKIFDRAHIDKSDNYFTVSLFNFNECYVERMDVENDLVYFDGKDTIIWRGKEYKRAVIQTADLERDSSRQPLGTGS